MADEAIVDLAHAHGIFSDGDPLTNLPSQLPQMKRKEIEAELRLEIHQVQYVVHENQHNTQYVIRTNNVKGFENHIAARRRVNGDYWVSKIYPRPRRTYPQETPVCVLTQG